MGCVYPNLRLNCQAQKFILIIIMIPSNPTTPRECSLFTCLLPCVCVSRKGVRGGEGREGCCHSQEARHKAAGIQVVSHLFFSSLPQELLLRALFLVLIDKESKAQRGLETFSSHTASVWRKLLCICWCVWMSSSTGLVGHP